SVGVRLAPRLCSLRILLDADRGGTERSLQLARLHLKLLAIQVSGCHLDRVVVWVAVVAAGQADPGDAGSPNGPLGCHAGEVAVPGVALETGMISLALGAPVGYARLSSSTGMVRTPAVWRSYSAKPG